MAVTQQELKQFHDYVLAKLVQPEPPASLQDCLAQWQRNREEADTDDDLRQAMAEIDAGVGVSWDDAAARLRQSLSWYGQRS